MSLKAFHLVFIVSAILLALGFGAWSWMNYNSPQGVRLDLVWAVASLVSAVGLVIYEIYFLRKLKNVSFI
ncbi:MAG: hypothetical protein JWR19_2576 [Pedosphaera sp.]|jgi:uncharacterized membrane protein YidH (DUF202 family)|nr:hypothetical protein [Pedosphaera sp.]